MLINENKKETKNVKFISYKYDGAICYGELCLVIDGKEYSFSLGAENRFWSSGGSIGFNSNYTKSYINYGDWIIDVNELSDELKPFAQEIDYIFNSNVPKGCCGYCL